MVDIEEERCRAFYISSPGIHWREDDVNDATLLFTEFLTLVGVLLVSHHFYRKTKAEDNRNGARRRPTQTQTIELRLDLKWKKLYWPAEAAEAMAKAAAE